MHSLSINTRTDFETTMKNYPSSVQPKMSFLRSLVLETARESAEIDQIEECLKWGEPSFVTKHGSTLRMDWKVKTPNQYAFYFQCTSRLVETFNLVYGSRFKYEGKRAIVFDLEEKIPVEDLKKCVEATLMYHKRKHHVTLGL